MSILLSLSHLSFGYPSAAGDLFHDLSVTFPLSWTGIVGANGSGKTTLLELLSGRLSPDAGFVRRNGSVLLCEQKTDLPPEGADELFSSCDARAFQLRENLCITPDMPGRWKKLSMGERKKIQIAAALFRCPDILCVDEPTNHLDAAAREQLLRELDRFHGIGILVSHDRELLDSLCVQCLFLSTECAVLRPGGVSAGLELGRQEIENSRKQRHLLKAELKRTRAELQRRREKEQAARNKNTKRKIAKNDHDAKGKIDGARLTGRDRAAGDLAGAQVKNVTNVQKKLNAVDNWRLPDLGLNIPYGKYSPKNLLLDMLPFEIPLHKRKLIVPELSLGSRDRVALTGDNGAGKSMLLHRIVPELKLSPEEILYMPQELDAAMTEAIHETLLRLPKADYSRVMNVVASLGSVPERVLNAEICSPGEWRKLFFGLGVLREIRLIVMDEPTNHLDLPSIECLEAALADCECALLLVSHDKIFLDRLCSIHWCIETGGGAENHLIRLL